MPAMATGRSAADVQAELGRFVDERDVTLGRCWSNWYRCHCSFVCMCVRVNSVRVNTRVSVEVTV